MVFLGRIGDLISAFEGGLTAFTCSGFRRVLNLWVKWSDSRADSCDMQRALDWKCRRMVYGVSLKVDLVWAELFSCLPSNAVSREVLSGMTTSLSNLAGTTLRVCWTASLRQLQPHHSIDVCKYYDFVRPSTERFNHVGLRL